jgi:hypothetical protein
MTGREDLHPARLRWEGRPLLTDLAVDLLAEEVGVTVMAGGSA